MLSEHIHYSVESVVTSCSHPLLALDPVLLRRVVLEELGEGDYEMGGGLDADQPSTPSYGLVCILEALFI